MKKILKPKQFEEAIYFSDFTGKPFPGGSYRPPVTVKFEFNYNSSYDNCEFTLHLDDKDVEPILDLVQSKLNPDVKKILKDAFDENDEELENAIQDRDPMECEIRINDNNLIKRLLGNE
jgi:hypothetical protein